jgi:hypothetical protein
MPDANPRYGSRPLETWETKIGLRMFDRPALIHITPWRSKYGLSRPSETDKTMTMRFLPTGMFSVVGEIGLRMCCVAALEMSRKHGHPPSDNLKT